MSNQYELSEDYIKHIETIIERFTEKCDESNIIVAIPFDSEETGNEILMEKWNVMEDAKRIITRGAIFQLNCAWLKYCMPSDDNFNLSFYVHPCTKNYAILLQNLCQICIDLGLKYDFPNHYPHNCSIFIPLNGTDC